MMSDLPTAHARYDVVELVFEGPDAVIPADHTPLEVVFTHSDGSATRVSGFWDGGSRYIARFSPEQEGRWTWASESAEPALDGAAGEIDVQAPMGHGPVRVADRFHFAHADGTRFAPVGTTAYNWLHQDDGLVAETIDAIAEAGFNKFRFMVFPQAGGHISHEPDLLPFEKDDAGAWDVTRPVVAFFRRLDDAVRALGRRGIQADVLIFNAYDGGHFGLDALTEEQDAVYLRYLVARLGAFSNVWWSLCNEFDILTDRTAARWDRAGELLRAVDAHDHLRSIHNWMELHDHNQPWVTHASIQNGSATTDFGRASLYRDAYRKPIVLDEIKYEGDITDRWGHLTGEELVHQFWITTVAGCYASHGESFLLENGSLHMVQGGPFRGDSPARLGFLRGILDAAPGGLDPIDKWDDPAYQAGVPRRQYLEYLGRTDAASWTFRLAQGNTGERLEVGDRFEVDVIDTWAMTVTPVGRSFVLTDVHRNEAFAADSAPVELPPAAPIALRITRVTD